MHEISRFSFRICALALMLLVASVAAADGDKKTETDAGKTGDQSKTKSKVITTTKAADKPVVAPYAGATRKSPAVGEDVETIVITNDYLEKMMSGLTDEERLQGVYQAERHIGDPQPDAAAEGQPGAEAAANRPEGEVDTVGQPAASEKPRSVAELNSRITELERRLLALKNPLLPRRYSDKKDEESEDWDEQDLQMKIATTEQELADARAELAAAQKGGGSR